MSQPLLLAITGPTGIGKTEICIELARRYECPILNCDSRQIYKALPIGTAAPTALQRQQAEHYFVGTHSLEDTYNAGQYERDAVKLLKNLMTGRQQQPFAIMAGGSMMYMDAVLYGLDDIPEADKNIRLQLQSEYASKGITTLQEKARELDPDYYDTMADRQNPQRLIHCMNKEKTERPWKTIKIALNMPRETLYERINRRVDEMTDDGMEEEAKEAYEKVKHLHPLPNSLCTVGYREWIQYFNGEISREDAVALIKQNTRHFAKRQLTWLRRQKDVTWIEKTDNKQTIEEIDICIKKQSV